MVLFKENISPQKSFDYFSCAVSKRLLLLHYHWQRFYIGFIFCDIQRYTQTTSFINQATPITSIVKFIAENKDSRAFVDENMESKCCCKVFLNTKHFQE